MEQSEARNGVKLLCYKWRARLPSHSLNPDLQIFLDWLIANNYGHYLEFPSEKTPAQDIGLWLAEEFRRS